jgi:imidazolonepropionase-like amidohydrolase
MKKMKLSGLLFALAMSCSTAVLAATTLIQDVRVFDGKLAHERRSVLLVDGTIANADFHGPVPAGAKVVAGSGRTLLPGLIDAHVHAYAQFDLPLLFGVTTQVDMFTGVNIMQDFARAMAKGENRHRADLYSAGTLVTAKGGHGTQFGVAIPTLGGPADAQAFIDARIAEGSHFIKIVLEEGSWGQPMNSLDLATVKAAIEAAHKRGKLAVVHVTTLAHAKAALAAGADGLVHLFLGSEIERKDIEELARQARARKAFVIPTLSVLESMAGLKPAELLADAALAGMLTKEQQQVLKASYGPSPKPEQLSVPKAVTAALSKAGVPVLAGTDAGNPGTQYGVSLHHELRALVDAGLSPHQALAAATSLPAEAFRLGKRGRVATGYKADLLLVEGNPLADIAHTRRIVEVWKDGESANALRDSQRDRVTQERGQQVQDRVALPSDGRIGLFGKEKLASPFGLGWGPSTDSFLGGASTVRLEAQPDAIEGHTALVVQAQVAEGFAFPWSGVAFMPGERPMQPANLSAARALKFRVRGDGQQYQLVMLSNGVRIPASVPFTAGAQWAEVAVPLSAFAGIDSAALTMIGFNAGPKPGAYRFEIADVRLLGQHKDN